MNWEEKEITEVCSSIVDCVNRTAPKVEYLEMLRKNDIEFKEEYVFDFFEGITEWE